MARGERPPSRAPPPGVGADPAAVWPSRSGGARRGRRSRRRGGAGAARRNARRRPSSGMFTRWLPSTTATNRRPTSRSSMSAAVASSRDRLDHGPEPHAQLGQRVEDPARARGALEARRAAGRPGSRSGNSPIGRRRRMSRTAFSVIRSRCDMPRTRSIPYRGHVPEHVPEPVPDALVRRAARPPTPGARRGSRAG